MKMLNPKYSSAALIASLIAMAPVQVLASLTFGANSIASDSTLSVTGSTDFSTHLAVGSGGAISNSVVLDLAETVTSITAGFKGISNELTLTPGVAAVGTIYGASNAISVPSSNTQNFGGQIIGNYNELLYEGSGTVLTIKGNTTYIDMDEGDVVTNAIGDQFLVYGARNIWGIDVNIRKDYSAIAGSVYGGYYNVDNGSDITSGTDNTYGLYVDLYRYGSSGGTANAYGQYINMGFLQNGGAGTTNGYGLYISNVTGADNNYSIYSVGGQGYHEGNLGLGTNAPTEKLDINSDNLRIRTAKSPASNATCDTGEMSWDASYIYVCTATNTWERAALTGGY